MIRNTRFYFAIAGLGIAVKLACGQSAPSGGMAVEAPPAEALAPVRPNQSLTMNAMLGFINSEPVFVDTVLRPIDEQLKDLAKNSRNLTDFKEGARIAIDNQLQQVISNMLLVSSANAALTAEDKGKLDFYMNKQRHDLLAKYGGSRALADQALKAQDSSVDKELAKTRQTIIVELYKNKQLYPKIVITRQMELDEYEKDAKQWRQPEEVDLFTITLPIKYWLPHDPGEKPGEKGPVSKNPTAADIAEAKKLALKTADDVVGQLKKATNFEATFAQLAEDNRSADGRATKGGLTPRVERGSRVNQIEEDYIFSLAPHTLGKPLFIDDADPLKARVEVIAVGDKKEARTVPFQEAQDSIREALQKREFDKLLKEYMEKLSQTASIEHLGEMADTALQVAVARYATR